MQAGSFQETDSDRLEQGPQNQLGDPARLQALLSSFMTGLGCMQDAANRGSIQTVQIKGPNTNWETLNNIWGASWEVGQSPQPPLDFRIQDDQGVDVSLSLLFL